MRIRQRYALTLCGGCMILFLVLYFILNYAVPSEDRTPTYADSKRGKILVHDNSLQVEEDDYVVKDLKRPKKRLEHHGEDKLVKSALKEKANQKPQLAHKQHDLDVKTGEHCEFDVEQAPQPDIQMLDLYTHMSFADNDGGVWKQGWDVKYDPQQYNDFRQLQVFVVPHSHNDPGWKSTFEDYYEHQTKHILSNALRHLRDNPEMTLIWAEISYFARFFDDLGPSKKQEMKKIIQSGQFEFVTGGWVMPDEANSHWHSILMQLTEGQTYLKQHFNVTPTASWAIDPFGCSPTLPYIFQKSGFKNMLIQRTHYSVKKALAMKRNLEFYWRQLWDDSGSTDLFTHMMPFYSYDIPHTCGPDPKICCQFDFKRLQGYGLSCPWRVAPQAITDDNVAERAQLIVDQWKKKAELYSTNALLIPLGDDFRYSQSTEWDVQRRNYNALFDYINAVPELHVNAKFGTLQEYFEAVHKEDDRFPTLSGDFFTYADRSDNYWSGYFTSRPYHKRMDRVLLHYVRAAEMLHSWHAWDAEANFSEQLQTARRELSLFQHHDGITGTAKTHVMKDYLTRMLDAIKKCRFVMQQAVYRLLTKPTIYKGDHRFNYFYIDESRWVGPDESRTTIILGEELPTKHIVVHNSLPQWREELVDFHVSSPFVSVTDLEGKSVQAQVNPVWTWNSHFFSKTVAPQASTTKYRVIFKVKVSPLGLATYIIRLEISETTNPHTFYASNLILSTNPMSVNLGDYPNEVKFAEHREVSLRVGKGPTVAFGADGLLKSIQINSESQHTPINMRFYKYNTRISGDQSGAYLFLPNGPATPFINIKPPIVLVTEGPLEATITTGLQFARHQVVLRGDAPEIRNLVDIGKMDDTEIAMRFSTHIQSDNTFYTDLNGLQMIKRKYFSKLPLGGNYYPIPSAIYIEDSAVRLTVVGGQPLGGSSLAQGEIEIMQDRRLTHDDERGLGQGVLDNQPVLHIFRILLERMEGCTRPVETHPAGLLTSAAHVALKAILNPIDKFIFAENDWLGVQPSFGSERADVDADLEIVTMRNIRTSQSKAAVAHDRKIEMRLTTGVVVHRTSLLQCKSDKQSTGMFNLKNLYKHKSLLSVNSTTLTFLHQLRKEENYEFSLCPMDTKALLLTLNLQS